MGDLVLLPENFQIVDADKWHFVALTLRQDDNNKVVGTMYVDDMYGHKVGNSLEEVVRHSVSLMLTWSRTTYFTTFCAEIFLYAGFERLVALDRVRPQSGHRDG